MKRSIDELNNSVESQQDSIDDLAPKDSPSFTGTPTAPTASTNTDTTQIATTSFVKNNIDELTQDDISDGTTYVRTENNFSDEEKQDIVDFYTHIETKTGNPHSVTATDVNCLALDNTTPYDPTAGDAGLDKRFRPATKDYVDAKFSESGTVLNVKDYGAIGDSVNDDTTFIQSCFDESNDGDVILFPRGTYVISSLISSSKRVLIEGNNNTIICNSTGGFFLRGLEFGGQPGGRAQMQNFKFIGTRNDSQKTIVVFNNEITVKNILMHNCGVGFFVNGGYWHHISNIRMRNMSHKCIEIGSAIGTVVEDLRHDVDSQYYNNQPLYGIELYGEGCNFSDIDLIHSGTCLKIRSDVTRESAWHFFNSCSFDTSIRGCSIVNETTGGDFHANKGVMFQHCWFSNHDYTGLEINVTENPISDVNGITLNGCHFLTNGGNAIYIGPGSQNIEVNGCVFSGNSRDYPGVHPTIYTSSLGRKLIINNFFTSWGGTTSTVKADIERSNQDNEIFIDGNVSAGEFTAGGFINHGTNDYVHLGTNFGNLPSSQTTGLTKLEDDTNPVLGGNLSMNGHSIGGNSESQLDNAVSKAHNELHAASSHTDISVSGSAIDNAANKAHNQNTDTRLGNMESSINMNGYGLDGVSFINGTTIQCNIGSTMQWYFNGHASFYMDIGFLRPHRNQEGNLGSSGFRFWDIYAYNIYSTYGYFQDSQDDLAVLSEIQPKKDKTGKSVIHEESGFELIDLKEIPEHLTNYKSLKKEIENEKRQIYTDDEFKELLKNDEKIEDRLMMHDNAFSTLTNGGLRQLDKEANEMFDYFCERIHKLEQKIKELENK